MVETKSNASQIVKHVDDHFGKTIMLQYVNNLKCKIVKSTFIPSIQGVLCCGRFMDVLSTLRNNGKVFVCYGGRANQVKRISFSMYGRIETYNRFPEVICLDQTYNTNWGK